MPNFQTQRLYSVFSDKRPLSIETLSRLKGRYRPYAIILQPRSGSTLLTELLGVNGLGWAHEWLNPHFYEAEEEQLGCLPPSMLNAVNLDNYLIQVGYRYVGIAGLVGVEMTVDQVSTVYASMPRKPRGPFFETIFYLRRRDLLAQAVSLARAIKTGHYHSFQSLSSTPPETNEPAVEAVLQCVADIIFQEGRAEAMFRRQGWTPHRLWYEHVCQDREAAVRAVARTLGADIGTFVDASLARTAAGNADEWKHEVLRCAPDRMHDMLQYRPKT